MTALSPVEVSRPLELHEGICDPPAEGCARWPERLRLLASDGRLVPGRCRATNLCPYCQRLYIIETVEMLALDAAEYAPTIWLVLTAREHLTRSECYAHLRQLRKALRKRWPLVEWFVQVEFQRRGALHLNLLVKGVPVEEAAAFQDAAALRWCARVDALPVGQWGDVILQEAGGAESVIRYLSKMLAHGLKAEQAPPLGWKGHRTSHTRGYLVRPTWKMRAEARAALRSKRALWKAERAGLTGAEAEAFADAELLREEGRAWECVVVSEKIDRNGEIKTRLRALRGGSPDVKLRAIRDRRADRRIAASENYAGALDALDALAAEVERWAWPDDAHAQRVLFGGGGCYQGIPV